MNDIIMYGSALIAAIIVVIMLIKKIDVKITLFVMGIVLMYIAIAMGNLIAIEKFESTGFTILDPLKAVTDQPKSTLLAAGFIILILGGYSAYMTSIGASEVTVHTLTKPIKKIRSVYIPAPLVPLIGSALSLVIPNVPNLAITLLATPYPVLCQASMSPLTAAAVVAITTTVMPTPLGGDSVAIATELVKYPVFVGTSVTDYAIQYHAMISVPTLIVMAVVHFFWQKFVDKKNTGKLEDSAKVHEVKAIPEGGLYRSVYTLPPILPALLLIVVYIIHSVTGNNVDTSVEVTSLFFFLIAIVYEIIRTKNSGKILEQTKDFFKKMGGSMLIVALLVVVSVSILDLNSAGPINALQTVIPGVQRSGTGLVLPLVLTGLTILIVLLNRSGTALFHAMVPLIVPLAEAAGISAIVIPIPMGLCGSPMCTASLVATAVVIAAGMIRANPLDIVKCTSVPMIAGVVTMFVLSMTILL